DGANVELREEVGHENFFLFGLTAAEIVQLRAAGYRPADYYRLNPELSEAIDLVRSGFFSRGDTQVFQPLIDCLLQTDPYFVLADFQSYLESHGHVGRVYADREQWPRMSIMNAARSGEFSSD